MRRLSHYFNYYHISRAHLGLEKDCPVPRSVVPPENGRSVSKRSSETGETLRLILKIQQVDGNDLHRARVETRQRNVRDTAEADEDRVYRRLARLGYGIGLLIDVIASRAVVRQGVRVVDRACAHDEIRIVRQFSDVDAARAGADSRILDVADRCSTTPQEGRQRARAGIADRVEITYPTYLSRKGLRAADRGAIDQDVLAGVVPISGRCW